MPGVVLEARHHRVVQVPFGGEVPVDRALADAGALGDGAERQLPPVPAVEPVHQVGARGDDALTCLGGLEPARRAVVPARGSLDVSLIMVAVYCLEFVGGAGGGAGARICMDSGRRARPVSTTSATTRSAKVWRSSMRSLRDEARLNARGEGYVYPRIVGHLAPAAAGRGLVPPPPRDRRRSRSIAPLFGLGPAPHRFDRAVVPARPGSRRPVPAQLGVRAAVPAAVDGARRRPADPGRRGNGVGGQQDSRARRHRTARWSAWT